MLACQEPRFVQGLGQGGAMFASCVCQAAVSVHRLVQAVIQARLGHEGDRRWAEIAVSLLHASFPNRELGAGWLLEQASTYLRGRGLYRQTRPIAERAVAMTEAARGPANPQVGWRCGELGHVLHDLGDLEGARVQ